MRLVQIILALSLASAGGTAAEEMSPEGRPQFSGEEAATLEDALRNLETANEELEDHLDDSAIEGAAIAHVHELSYTLENALARIQEETADLAVILEEVHVASEKGDADVVLDAGRASLSIADQFTNKR